MKETTMQKAYTVNSMGLSRAQEAMAILRFKGGPVVQALIMDLPAIVREKGLRTTKVMSCEVEGIPTAVFPVVAARSRRAAAALSVITKTPITKGDGASCWSQDQAYEIARSVKLMGVPTKELRMEWMVGKPKAQLYTPKLKDYPLSTMVLPPKVQAQDLLPFWSARSSRSMKKCLSLRFSAMEDSRILWKIFEYMAYWPSLA